MLPKGEAKMRALTALTAVALFIVPTAYAAEGLRLIQDPQGTVRWRGEAEILELARASHEAGRCGGFMDLTEDDGLDLSAVATRQPLARVAERTAHARELIRSLVREVSEEELKATVAHLSSYKTRNYKSDTGKEAALWIRDRFQQLAAGRDDVEVELFEHSWKQPSVIARIKGSGSRAAETVVIGGHEDSIRLFGGTNAAAPGADDDASGVATVLEAFRVLMASGLKPERTLEFMTYAGEEAGLLGSQDIATAYRGRNRDVVGVLQFDMTMFPGPGKEIHFVTDHVNAELTQLVIKLNEEFVGAPWKETQCGYACSDHASWTRKGYPSAFPFESGFDDSNKKIHTAGDLLDIISPSHGVPFAKLAVAFLTEMAQGSRLH
jgi:bacterial leucyl aminopeptidase